MELEPPPAKKLRAEDDGDTHSVSNGESRTDANGQSKTGNGEVPAVEAEAEASKSAPVKTSSGSALKSDSKMSIKGKIIQTIAAKFVARFFKCLNGALREMQASNLDLSMSIRGRDGRSVPQLSVSRHN